MAVTSGTDLTRGNAAVNLLKFTVPFLLAFFLQMLYGMVDMLVVGHYGGGRDAVAAVANGGEVMHMVASLIMGLTTGATVLIGRYYGAQDRDTAVRCTGMTLSISAILAVVMTALMVPGVPWIAQVLKTPPEALSDTVTYGTICSWGIVFIVGYNALSAIFRGFGNSSAPLIFVAIACGVNVVGDLLLVKGLGMGVKGVAIATVSSQALSMLFALIFLAKSDFGFRFVAHNFRIPLRIAWQFIKIGVPVGVQSIMVGMSFLLLFWIVNKMGVTYSAAYGIGGKINSFAMLPAVAFAMAMSAVAAQNMGANKPKRALTSLRLGITYTMSFGAVVLTLLQLFPRQAAALFIDAESAGAEATLTAAVGFIRSFSWEFILVPIVFCTNGFFNGCGRAFFSMANNLGSTFLVRVPCALWFSHLPGATLFEVGFAAPLASFFSNIFAIYYLVSGRWRPARRK